MHKFKIKKNIIDFYVYNLVVVGLKKKFIFSIIMNIKKAKLEERERVNKYEIFKE